MMNIYIKCAQGQQNIVNNPIVAPKFNKYSNKRFYKIVSLIIFNIFKIIFNILLSVPGLLCFIMDSVFVLKYASTYSQQELQKSFDKLKKYFWNILKYLYEICELTNYRGLFTKHKYKIIMFCFINEYFISFLDLSKNKELFLLAGNNIINRIALFFIAKNFIIKVNNCLNIIKKVILSNIKKFGNKLLQFILMILYIIKNLLNPLYEFIKNNLKSIKNNSKSIKNNSKFIKNKSKFIKNSSKFIKDSSKFIKDSAKFIKDSSKFIKDNPKTSYEYAKNFSKINFNKLMIKLTNFLVFSFIWLNKDIQTKIYQEIIKYFNVYCNELNNFENLINKLNYLSNFLFKDPRERLVINLQLLYSLCNIMYLNTVQRINTIIRFVRMKTQTIFVYKLKNNYKEKDNHQSKNLLSQENDINKIIDEIFNCIKNQKIEKLQKNYIQNDNYQEKNEENVQKYTVNLKVDPEDVI